MINIRRHMFDAALELCKCIHHSNTCLVRITLDSYTSLRVLLYISLLLGSVLLESFAIRAYCVFFSRCRRASGLLIA